MKILLTNDDGITSSGIRIIEEVLCRKHEVTVVAPDSERSGYSNSLTLGRKLIIKKIDKTHYKCSGTPADCVHRTLLGAVHFVPDMVVSGINIGPNLGTDLIYSGTAAAARQAALMGVPSVAVSVASFREPFNFEFAAEFVLDNLEYFREVWDRNCFFNINVPQSVSAGSNVEVTRPARRMYNETIMKNTIEGTDSIEVSLGLSDIGHFDEKHINYNSDSENSRTDCDAIIEGKISVTPVYLHPVADLTSELYTEAKFGENNG